MAASSKEAKENNAQPLSEETLDEVTGGTGLTSMDDDRTVSKPVTPKRTDPIIPKKRSPFESPDK